MCRFSKRNRSREKSTTVGKKEITLSPAPDDRFPIEGRIMGSSNSQRPLARVDWALKPGEPERHNGKSSDRPDRLSECLSLRLVSTYTQFYEPPGHAACFLCPRIRLSRGLLLKTHISPPTRS